MRNYSRYFPSGSCRGGWGLIATACGFTRVPPGVPYPLRSSKPPPSHDFAWERGRTINEYQVIYICEGSGVFESTSSSTIAIPCQSLILLFPGVWHRYTPDKGTGWTEHWVELEGPILDSLVERHLLSPSEPWRRVPDPGLASSLFRRCHGLVKSSPAGFNVQLGWIAMQILTAIVPLPGPPRSHSNRSLVSAQQELAQSFGSGEKLAAIAQRLNMSYSHFRREFRNETGLPPGEYQRRSRLRRARELLATTNLTLKEIAEELGYYSAFHFSSDFKARMGLSPSIWRRRQL